MKIEFKDKDGNIVDMNKFLKLRDNDIKTFGKAIIRQKEKTRQLLDASEIVVIVAD